MCAKVLQNIENTKNLSENIVFLLKRTHKKAKNSEIEHLF